MTTQRVNSHDGHPIGDFFATDAQDLGYFSSSPLASPHSSPFSLGDEELSLGVYYSPEDGESNDVLAALRASARVVKETIGVVTGLRTRTNQVKELADMLHSHEREFTAWIFDGVGILPTTRIAVKSLSLYMKLAVYINLLQDIQSDLPYRTLSTPPPAKVSLLRRLSSSASTQSRPSAHSQSTQSTLQPADDGQNPKLTKTLSKVSKAFAALKDAIAQFGDEQRKLRATRDVLERTRKELGIPHGMCLQGTRNGVKTLINSWLNGTSPGPTSGGESSLDIVPVIDSSKPVLALVGSNSYGKSALATTLACEWKRGGMLGAHLFLMPPISPSRTRSSSGKHSSDESDGANGPFSGFAAHGKSLSRALSRITRRRGSNASAKTKQASRDIDSFEQAVDAIVAEKLGKRVLVVDGLDHASETDTARALEIIKRSAQYAKTVLTLRNQQSAALSNLTDAGLVEIVSLDGSEREESNPALKATIESDSLDISRYVSSRLAVMVTPKDQDRIVAAVEGSFVDAVRICREVEDSGASERALDVLLYHEAVRRHGSEHVKVVLV